MRVAHPTLRSMCAPHGSGQLGAAAPPEGHHEDEADVGGAPASATTIRHDPRPEFPYPMAHTHDTDRRSMTAALTGDDRVFEGSTARRGAEPARGARAECGP